MDAAFWHERWQRGEIGFHKASTNPLLQRWWPQLSRITLRFPVL